MRCDILFSSVHGSYCPPVFYGANGHFYESPVYDYVAFSLPQQIEQAAINNLRFQQALTHYREKNYAHLTRDPKFHISICPQALDGRFCTLWPYCPHAENLAELYASKLFSNPEFKSTVCKEPDCNEGVNCKFVHNGDLMQKWLMDDDGPVFSGWKVFSPSYE